MGTKSKGRSFLYGLSLAVLFGLTPQTLHAAPVKAQIQLVKQKTNKEKRLFNISLRLDKITAMLEKKPQNKRLQRMKARLLARQENVQKHLDRINAKLVPLTSIVNEAAAKPNNTSVQEEAMTLDSAAQVVVNDQAKEEAADQPGENADLQEADAALAEETGDATPVAQTPEPGMSETQGPGEKQEGTQVHETMPMHEAPVAVTQTVTQLPAPAPMPTAPAAQVVSESPKPLDVTSVDKAVKVEEPMPTAPAAQVVSESPKPLDVTSVDKAVKVEEPMPTAPAAQMVPESPKPIDTASSEKAVKVEEPMPTAPAAQMVPESPKPIDTASSDKGMKGSEEVTGPAPGAQEMPVPKSDAQMLGEELTTMEGELEAIQKNPGPDADAKMKDLEGKVRNIRFTFGVEFITNKEMKEVGERFMKLSRDLAAQKMGGKEKADDLITKGLDDMRVALQQILANPTPDMDARLEMLEGKLNAFTRQNVQAMGKTMISSAASLLNDIHKAQLGNGKLDQMINGFEAELGEIQKNKSAPDYGKKLDALGKKVQEVEMKSLGMATPEQKEKLDKLFLEAKAPMKI